jgi:hypothetical protein
MTRRLFTLAALLSLALCLATAVLWVHPVSFQFWTSRGLFEIASAGGQIRLDNVPQRQLEWKPIQRAILETNEKQRQLNEHGERMSRESREHPWWWNTRAAEVRKQDDLVSRFFAGVRLVRQWEKRPRTPLVRYSVSAKWATATTLALPLSWLVSAVLTARRNTRWRRNGLCPTCGYDLQATPQQCPECGAVPAEAKP